jgi:hypothetical protein
VEKESVMPRAKINSEQFISEGEIKKIHNPPEDFFWTDNKVTIIAKPFDFPMLSTHRVMRSDYSNIIMNWAESGSTWTPYCELAYPIAHLITISDEELSYYFSLWKDSTQRKLQLDLNNLASLIKQCLEPNKQVWTALHLLRGLEQRYLQWQKFLKSVKKSPTHLKTRHLKDLILHLDSLSINEKSKKSILADLLKAFGFTSPINTARNILDSPIIKIQ